MINVGIVGISGYTGEELLKILSRHKSVEIKTLCGRQDSPIRKLKEFYPQFSHLDMVVQPLNIKEMSKSCNIVFLALPHGASFPIVEQLLEAGIKVIDLSADFRLKDPQVYE
ncbi:MAG: Gfo/Idh/MocA family oxidoreductase, partial [Elusimicrobiota bacterium]|nr:Gfo/Idh/MocA family oxidoreductase [Elusimicrobiota bacterium]